MTSLGAPAMTEHVLERIYLSSVKVPHSLEDNVVCVWFNVPIGRDSMPESKDMEMTSDDIKLAIPTLSPWVEHHTSTLNPSSFCQSNDIAPKILILRSVFRYSSSERNDAMMQPIRLLASVIIVSSIPQPPFHDSSAVPNPYVGAMRALSLPALVRCCEELSATSAMPKSRIRALFPRFSGSGEREECSLHRRGKVPLRSP